MPIAETEAPVSIYSAKMVRLPKIVKPPSFTVIHTAGLPLGITHQRAAFNILFMACELLRALHYRLETPKITSSISTFATVAPPHHIDSYKKVLRV